jgi:hypothetical protein
LAIVPIVEKFVVVDWEGAVLEKILAIIFIFVSSSACERGARQVNLEDPCQGKPASDDGGCGGNANGSKPPIQDDGSSNSLPVV